jgi:sensor histidine kinase YesM
MDLRIEGDFKSATIAPLLLLPLAENCFKHGTGNSESSIQIEIQYFKGTLYFKTLNTIARRENPIGKDQGGIGIINVEKRLNLLYPDHHKLTFKDDGHLFQVEMEINLDLNR